MGKADIICLCNWHGIGGAQLNAGMLTAEFQRRGYAAELGFLFEREPEARHGTKDFFVVADGAPSSPQGWYRFLRDSKRQILDRRPKAIFGFQPMANIMGSVIAKRLGDCRMIATQRNPSDRQSPIVARLERAIGGTGLYDANIAVSRTVAGSFSTYPESYRRRMRVVHNATPALPPVFDGRDASRARFGMPQSGLVLGVLGRLHTQKNTEFAIDIVNLLPDARLYLAGDGPEEGRLRQKVVSLGLKDRVVFLGAVRGEDITRFYQAIDVLLFCSIYEGFGRVLVEAMSQSTPVVASDIPIAREVGGDAALFRPFDPQQWAGAINALAADEVLRRKSAAGGPAQAAKFQLAAMVEGYLEAAGLPPIKSSENAA
jgi:glycosyltransferase involved in cell wall biosynthesis